MLVVFAGSAREWNPERTYVEDFRNVLAREYRGRIDLLYCLRRPQGIPVGRDLSAYRRILVHISGEFQLAADTGFRFDRTNETGDFIALSKILSRLRADKALLLDGWVVGLPNETSASGSAPYLLQAATNRLADASRAFTYAAISGRGEGVLTEAATRAASRDRSLGDVNTSLEGWIVDNLLSPRGFVGRPPDGFREKSSDFAEGADSFAWPPGASRRPEIGTEHDAAKSSIESRSRPRAKASAKAVATEEFPVAVRGVDSPADFETSKSERAGSFGQRSGTSRPRRWLVARDRQVPLLFASNRNRVPGKGVALGTEEKLTLVYGRCNIRIPETHRFGKLERPGFFKRIISLVSTRVVDDPKKHFVLASARFITETQFRKYVSSSSGDVVVFVHGFNVNPEGGLFQLAQIIWDLQLKGPGIAFLWPARARIVSDPTDYLYDKDRAEFARPLFAALAKLLLDSIADGRRVHIIAHSMGNQIVLGALRHLSVSAPTAFGELVCAAPDVAPSIFAEQAGVAIPLMRGSTLYASSADKALKLAGKLWKGARAGDVPVEGPLVVPGLETIDVTAIGDHALGLNHSTYATGAAALNDLALLLKHGNRPPNDRTAQIRPVPEGTSQPKYWRYQRQ